MRDQAFASLSGADRALFASDMHLGEHDPATAELFFRAFEDALAGRLHTSNLIAQSQPVSSQSLQRSKLLLFTHIFLLGDLFEVWIGDDDLSHHYAKRLSSLLTLAKNAGTQIFIVRGNRDFLLGQAPFGKPTWLEEGLARFLPDPFSFLAFGEPFVLTHGDLLCTDDIDYQKYRKQVRSPAWQSEYLAKPLSERQSIAQDIRKQSKMVKGERLSDWMDAKDEAVLAMFDETKAKVMIHGHTHRPALHLHRQGGELLSRYVLPDWSATGNESQPQRGYFLMLDELGMHQLQPVIPPF